MLRELGYFTIVYIIAFYSAYLT